MFSRTRTTVVVLFVTVLDSNFNGFVSQISVLYWNYSAYSMCSHLELDLYVMLYIYTFSTSNQTIIQLIMVFLCVLVFDSIYSCDPIHSRLILVVSLFVWWCLTSLSTIFQLYRGDQFYWWRTQRKTNRPVASHWQTLSHNVVHLALIEIRAHISGDRHWLHR